MDILSFFGTAAVGASITAFFTFRNNERNIKTKNITEERAKWREKIRELNTEASKADNEKDFKRFQYEFRVQLNPFDNDDNEIIELFDDINDLDEKKKELSIKLSLLLKHDWERSKSEVEKKVFFDRLKNLFCTEDCQDTFKIRLKSLFCPKKEKILRVSYTNHLANLKIEQ